MTVRVLIVDDEELARQRLQRLLASEQDVEIIGEVSDGAQAVVSIRALVPDLVFLDVQMPEVDGFAVLERLRPRPAPAVIFVTAHDDYALRAFEVHAVDYLRKPFDAARFKEAFTRARQRLAGAGAEEHARKLDALLAQVETNPPRSRERIMVRTDGRLYFVRIDDIDWIEAAGNYVKLHVGRETHLMRETMTGIEKLLDPTRFLRIHRSAIVNLDRVREMQPWFSGEYTVILRDGTQLRLSRVYRDRLEAWMHGPRE
ncbi:MAG: LytR/AlgR family response regulator transcription factor [Gemmatimonadaceae bacterium]